jgi:hypothetical protein
MFLFYKVWQARWEGCVTARGIVFGVLASAKDRLRWKVEVMMRCFALWSDCFACVFRALLLYLTYRCAPPQGLFVLEACLRWTHEAVVL